MRSRKDLPRGPVRRSERLSRRGGTPRPGVRENLSWGLLCPFLGVSYEVAASESAESSLSRMLRSPSVSAFSTLPSTSVDAAMASMASCPAHPWCSSARRLHVPPRPGATPGSGPGPAPGRRERCDAASESQLGRIGAAVRGKRRARPVRCCTPKCPSRVRAEGDGRPSRGKQSDDECRDHGGDESDQETVTGGVV